LVSLNLQPQRFAWTENMLLTYEILQALRAHALGQRTLLVDIPG
jgi:hypothetical protein